MDLTYEQLAPAMYRWAIHFAGRFRQFEIHELINEVWQKGKIQKLENIKFASKRARNDMIDYIRNETKFRKPKIDRRYKIKTKSALRIPNMTSVESRMPPGSSILSILKARIDPRTAEVDTKDLFRRLCRGLKPLDALALKLWVVVGYNQHEIARITGYKASYISLRLKSILPEIKQKLLKLGIRNEMEREINENDTPNSRREVRCLA